MVINRDTGNVGIGTTSPDENFVVSSDSGADIKFSSHHNTDTNSSRLFFYKSGGTAASPSIVADDEMIGAIYGYGHDGGNYESTAAIIFDIDGSVSSNVVPGRIEFHTNEGGQALTEQMRIAADGKVGIGTNNPTSLLHILQVSASSGAARNTAHEGIRVQNATGTAGNATMGVNDFGYAEIGQDNSTGDGNRSVAWLTDSSHQFWVDGYASGTEHFRIAANGDLTATDDGGSIGAISDERTKKNIQTYSGSLSIINTLRPVTYEWKSNRKNSGRKRGFIAQEVTSSDAFWVVSSSVEPHAPDWEYLEGMPQIDSGAPTGSRSALVSKLTAKDTMYVSAIQELTQAVRDLRAQITGSTDLGQLKAFVSGSTFV